MPQRTKDSRQDPRFRGWWPKTHPSMSSFLGVPIVSGGGVVAGASTSPTRRGARFSDDDQSSSRRSPHTPRSLDGDALVAAAVEGDAFRIAQEALHNAIRHAGPQARIAVALRCEPGRLELTVTDDGAGFYAQAVGVRSRRLGLTTMAGPARTRAGRPHAGLPGRRPSWLLPVP